MDSMPKFSCTLNIATWYTRWPAGIAGIRHHHMTLDEALAVLKHLCPKALHAVLERKALVESGII